MVPFVGPSYNLDVSRADVQRAINLYPVANEVAGGKSDAYLAAAPGLAPFSDGVPAADVDPYIGNVAALLRFDGASGSTVQDAISGAVWTMYHNGSPPDTLSGFSSASPIVGTESLWLRAYASEHSFSNGILNTPGNPAWAAPGDFTLELWHNTMGHTIYASSSPAAMVCCHTSTGTLLPLNSASTVGEWALTCAYRSGSGNYLAFTIAGTDNTTHAAQTVAAGSAYPIPQNVDYHIAVTRQAGILYLWQNGVLVGTQGGSLGPANYPLRGDVGVSIGGRQLGAYLIPNDYGTGKYDELRFTPGVARYTSNFTPAKVPFPGPVAAGVELRGLCADSSQRTLYAVRGNQLLRVARDGTTTALGTLQSRSGLVDMRVGTSQLVIVDGANLYAYDLAARTLTRVTSEGWLGSVRLGYVKGSYLFSDPGTGTFYISALEDATSEDPLDFATASNSPDNTVASVDNHGEAWLFGEATTEVWSYTGAADFPLEQNAGANMEVGCLAAFTVQSLGGVPHWLGRDANGAGRVYRARGYAPEPISNEALEQKIADAIEAGQAMSDACAYAYEDRGHGFYCLQIPGLDTTWVFDTKSGQWHERAELVNGEYRRHRARLHAYCYGKHIVGGDDGALYVLDAKANTNAGDVLVRDRISPHYALPSLGRIIFGDFELDCTVGKGKAGGAEARVMMRYSDNGGATWSDWRTESLGAIGERGARARFLRTGSAFDRVWHVRCVDDVPFSIVQAKVPARARS